MIDFAMDFKCFDKKSTRDGFAEGLLAFARKDSSIVGLGADITNSVGMDLFAKTFPKRFISLGIAEQNCIGVAAGMALSGKKPVFSSYGAFSALRCADQIRISLCYNDLPVLIGGAHSGLSVGPDGATHQVLEDIAYIRSLPNMRLISPCDATQTKLAVMAALETLKHPTFMRYGREKVCNFTSENQKFEIGKAQILQEGSDIAIIATGPMVWWALKASEILKSKRIHAAVLNIHTIKPLDVDAIVKISKKTNAVVVAEEHQRSGGLGSAVSEVLAQHHPVCMEFVAMNDTFGGSGQPGELRSFYELDVPDIVKAAQKVIYRKKNI